MSSKLLFLATRGQAKVDGFAPEHGNWHSFDHEAGGTVQNPKANEHRVQLQGDASGEAHGEFHLGKHVGAGGPPTQGHRGSMRLRVHMKNGVFSEVKVLARPRSRKTKQDGGRRPAEIEPSMHKAKRQVKVTKRSGKHPTEFTYTIFKKSAGAWNPRLKLIVHT